MFISVSREKEMLEKLFTWAAILGVAFTLGVAPALAAGDDEPDPERECKSAEVSRTGGRAKTMFWARKSARDAWRNKVKAKYGNDWSGWYSAEETKYTCFKEEGRNRCTARGKPCKIKVVIQGPRKVCAFYKIAGTGKAAKLKAWAQHNARKIWAERVREFYGNEYDTWLLAKSRENNCKDNADGTHECTATAKPCHFKIIN
jgi:hypothetical protein